jgi:hypothetical protein
MGALLLSGDGRAKNAIGVSQDAASRLTKQEEAGPSGNPEETRPDPTPEGFAATLLSAP